MQYHLNGFRSGDPDLKPRSSHQSDECDVLIIGAGPAGLTLAAYLSGFETVNTVLWERKSSPLEKGQADGVSCRSMEMFQTFGFSEKVMREAYWVNEATFWKPDPDNPSHIQRTGRVQDVQDGLSEMPHVILNQARVHDMYLDVMKNGPNKMEPKYGRQFLDARQCDDGRIEVRSQIEDGTVETIKTRFLVGCDGARSQVRSAINLKLEGDAANKAWGVMDVLCVTDFPDIRFKSLIQSADQGSVLVIPREGGYLVRLYVELDKLDPNERISNRDLKAEDLIAAANRILSPFTLDVKDLVWWSVYEIGQRLTPVFDNRLDVEQPNIFIAGDACHTHSPKAGQGMNVSMGDAFNLGWKLVHVLDGKMPADALKSYSDERQGVAQDLINFDTEWARIMSSGSNATSAEKMQEYFIEHGRYTAGVSVKYRGSHLIGQGAWQHLAPGFQIGERLHSAPVIRLGDGKPTQLGHVQSADGRWLVIAFAERADCDDLVSLCTALSQDPALPLLKYTQMGADIDQLIDFRAVLAQSHHELQITDVPNILFPTKGMLGLKDYEKVFCKDDSNGKDIFQMRHIDKTKGCVVIVRPDQYVANILPLSAHTELSGFFDGVFENPKQE